MVSSRLPQSAFFMESDVSSPFGYPQGSESLPGFPSLQIIIEHGFNCLERGLYAEGAVFFTMAREQTQSMMSLQNGPLTAALDALNAAVAAYLQAHKTLLEASKRLAESDNEQETQVAALRKLLPTLTEINTPSPKTPSTKEPRRTQPLGSLRLVHSSTSSIEEETNVGAALASSSLSPGQPAPIDRPAPSTVRGKLPALYITCFGRFEVRRFDASGPTVCLCNNLKGQVVLRYLIAHPKRRETVEMLMTKLWPEEAPEAAQHKLRVAISALRCSLNRDVISEQGGGYILCKDQVYQINPVAVLQSDVDEFLSLYHAGQQASGRAAIDFFEKACNLYAGPFLAEDIYEEWSFIRREELTKVYVTMCDRLAGFHLESGDYEAVVRWASAMLKVDRCDEGAHRQLIRAYAGQKRRSEALRQYQQCQRILAEELGVEPMPETQRLFQMLLKGQDVLPTPDRHTL